MLRALANCFLRARLNRSNPRRTTPAAPRPGLGLEALEDRCTPSLTTVTNYTAYPYNATVFIETVFQHGVGHASGSLIDADHVLTAGHVLYDPPLGPWQSIRVWAGRSGGNFYATSDATNARTFLNFTNDPHSTWTSDGKNSHPAGDGDIGLITLRNPLGPYFGYDTTKYTSGGFSTQGYPDGRPDMEYQSGALGSSWDTQFDSSGNPLFGYYWWNQSSVSVVEGQSGSPIYYSRDGQHYPIIGVIESTDTTGHGYAERLTPSVWNALQGAMNADHGSGTYDYRAALQDNAATRAASSTALSTSAATTTADQPAALSVWVSGGSAGTPSGSVAFYDNGTYLGSVSLYPLGGRGYAGFSTGSLGVGSHFLTAAYSGDGGHQGSSDFLSQTINPARQPTSAYLTAYASSVAAGQAVTVAAWVLGGPAGPTGTVSFYDGNTYLGSASLSPYTSGWAATTFSTSTLAVGTHLLTASYGGDARFRLSSSPPVTVSVVYRGDSFTVAEFPGLGVWRHSALRGWQQLAPNDASAVAVDAAGDVAAAFPGAGVWRFRDAGGWQQLAPNSASLVAIAGTGVVAAELPGGGVWRYRDAGGWRQLAPNHASAVAVDAAGDVAANLPGGGVWRFRDSTGWQQLAPNNASQVSMAGTGVVAVEFPGAGVWRYRDAGGWQRLAPNDASAVAVDAAGDVAADLPGGGVWRYRDSAGWQQLTANDASQVAIDLYADVAIDLLGSGVWRYDDLTHWALLTGSQASRLAAAGG